MIGKTVSHYRILEKLGEGGMGIVYKAEDTKLKRTVALKFLPPDLFRDSQAKQRFIFEAQTASALEHNNICNIHEIDETKDGQMFIAMACYEGQILSERIEAGSLKLAEAVDITMQIANGLAEVHKRGIIHRDIKPSNIFVTADGQIKILDFGIAKLIGEATITKTGTIKGSPKYMSPEQVEGREIDHRTDVWSLGAVLYEMITGQAAFQGQHIEAIFYSILREDPEPIYTIMSDVPHELVRVVDKALNKDPQCRYQKMDEFVFDLQFLKRSLELEIIGSSDSISPIKNRIVVLPFANFSAHSEDEYFADGMTEELISTLSRIQELRVIARTSAMKYKTVSKSVSEIARELNVGSILEGSIRKSGNKLRVTVQLIDAECQDHLWAEDYDRELKDIFAIQSDIAQRVAQSLKIHLLRGEKHDIDRRATEDIAAYRYYLMGRYHWNKRNEEGLETCITYFKNAIEKDKTYALAYAGLADAYVAFGNYGYLPPKRAFPSALSAAEKALEIDETLAEAHTSLAVVKCLYDWDWEEGEREFKHAILLNDRYAVSHHWYAINFLTPHGRFEEAIHEMQRALEFDPLSLIIHSTIGLVYYFARQYETAIEHLQDALRMSQDFEAAHFFLGWVFRQKGEFEKAIVSMRKALELSGGKTTLFAELGCLYAASGEKKEALHILQELMQHEEKGKMNPYTMYSIAGMYVGLGEESQAIEWLQKAASERCYRLIYLNVDPQFDSIRSNPQFIQLVRNVGLESQFIPPTLIRD